MENGRKGRKGRSSPCAKDMLLVGPQADQLLNRTGEEITEKQLFREKGVERLNKRLEMS